MRRRCRPPTCRILVKAHGFRACRGALQNRTADPPCGRMCQRFPKISTPLALHVRITLVAPVRAIVIFEPAGEFAVKRPPPALAADQNLIFT